MDICTGTESYSTHQSISISPNPTNSLITISYPANATAVFVTDVIGKRVLAPTLKGVNANNSSLLGGVQIDISSSPAGIYFLQVKTPDGVAVKKIIKQ